METIRVLYVEDDSGDWELTRRQLQRDAPHLKLSRAATVSEALDEVTASVPDVVMSDYRLPDGTGLDVLDGLRRRGVRAPVVLVTGSGDVDTAVRLLKAGATDYVVKREGYLATLPAVLDGAFQWFQSVDELRRGVVRVLYAEHDLADVALTRRAFTEHGEHLHLEVVGSGMDALRRLRQASFDLFLLDYRLPDLSGIEVLKALREERLTVSSVMVTGQGDEVVAVEAMKLGAADYLVKRDGYFARLPIALEHVLVQRRLADERQALLVLNAQTRSIASIHRADDVAERVAQSAANLVKAETAVLWLAEGESFRPAAWLGADDTPLEHLALAVDGPWTERLVLERHVPARALVERARSRDAVVRVLGPEGSSLIVSLVGDERPIGLLAVVSRQPREYRATDERLLVNLADHAAVALDNARLYAQVREQLADLRRTQDRLVQTEKIAAMGQILAGVAHELNNPLSVVIGYATLLRMTMPAGPAVSRLEKMHKAAERCARIVQNFLALARRRPPERGAVDTNVLVLEAAELLGYSLRVDGVEVVLDLAPDLPALWADPHQLQQVIVNLVGNAHHALRRVDTPRRLTVTTRRGPGADRVTLTVGDSGPGVPGEIRARIFEPFFTTKLAGEGTGLGLSLCRSIVESHAGTLTLDEREGAGALFRVELPVTPPPPDAAAAAGVPGESAVVKDIMVVEDDRVVAEVLVEILTTDRHRVEVAANGDEALALLQARSFDVIVSDIRMPGLDGPGLYREIERRSPALCQRFVFISGDALRSETQQFLERVKRPSFSKPLNLDEIRRAIEAIGSVGA